MNPSETRRLRDAALAFNRAYSAYLQGGPNGSPALRDRVLELMPAAQKAVSRVGVQITLYPPPAFGGPVLHGLANVAFAHETAMGFGADEGPRTVMSALKIVAAQLEENAKDEERRRESVAYRIDAALRAFLGIPAYIVSLFLPRLSFRQIDSSAAGGPLRLFGLACEALLVYFAGHAAHWW